MYTQELTVKERPLCYVAALLHVRDRVFAIESDLADRKRQAEALAEQADSLKFKKRMVGKVKRLEAIAREKQARDASESAQPSSAMQK